MITDRRMQLETRRLVDEKTAELQQRVAELEAEVEIMRRENLALTEMLDEGQSLAMYCGDPEIMYMIQRDLANWAGRANTLMYEQYFRGE